jgi:hypothetical protein
MDPLTIAAELRLPGPCMQGGDMAAVERFLAEVGLMPPGVTARRGRMDPETPGGYILSFRYTVPEEMPHA